MRDIGKVRRYLLFFRFPEPLSESFSQVTYSLRDPCTFRDLIIDTFEIVKQIIVS